MGRELTLLSHAKVNLTLDVVGQRPEDGYHYVETVMVPISLSDRITVTPSETISVITVPDIPAPPEQNLAYRAAVALKQRTRYPHGATIRIDKVIPVAGGLAGGSTNAAAVLKGLNRLWDTGLDGQALVDLAIGLGSDVPFFIPERPALVEGIGERLTPLDVRSPMWMVLAVPDVEKSTGNVYRLFDQLTEVRRPRTSEMVKALAEGNLGAVATSLGNVFEQVMLPRHPDIASIRQTMLDYGALGALMSGAGPTVLGIVRQQDDALALRERLIPLVRRVFVVHTVAPRGD